MGRHLGSNKKLIAFQTCSPSAAKKLILKHTDTSKRLRLIVLFPNMISFQMNLIWCSQYVYKHLQEFYTLLISVITVGFLHLIIHNDLWAVFVIILSYFPCWCLLDTSELLSSSEYILIQSPTNPSRCNILPNVTLINQWLQFFSNYCNPTIRRKEVLMDCHLLYIWVLAITFSQRILRCFL